jgi:hypothetical protein
MKSAVYEDSPHSLCDMKEATTYFLWNISHIEQVQIFTNEIKRVDACLQAHGGYFQHLL